MCIICALNEKLAISSCCVTINHLQRQQTNITLCRDWAVFCCMTWRVTHGFQLSPLQAIINLRCVAHKHWTSEHMQSGYGQISAKTRRLLSDHSELGLVHFALLWRGGWVERESAEAFFMLKSCSTWNGKPTNFKFWNHYPFLQEFGHNIFLPHIWWQKVKTEKSTHYKNPSSIFVGNSMAMISMFFISWRSPASPWASTSFLICGIVACNSIWGFGLMLSLP